MAIRAYNPKFNHYIITDILSKINENSKETDSLKMLNSQNIYQFTNTDNQQVFDIIEECKEVIQMCLEGKCVKKTNLHDFFPNIL